MRDRIKFFSVYDLSIGFYIDKLKEKLDLFNSNIEYNDINDILELMNIECFIENNIFHKDWTNDQIQDYQNKVLEFPKVLGKFLSKITTDNIINKVSTIDIIYIDDFWKIFSEYKIYKKIKEETFENILKLNDFYINHILKYKSIVAYYDKLIKNYLLLHNDRSVELYLDEYFTEKENNQSRLFFPISLTKAEKEKQLELYITEDLKKLNYFQLILKSSSHQELTLSPFLKRKAKILYNKLTESFFENNNYYYTYGYEISFQPNQANYVIIEKEISNNSYIKKFKYNLDWVIQNLDYPTILNNFIYLFKIVDNYFIFTNVKKRGEIGFFESRFLRSQVKNEYITGNVFNSKKIKTELKIKSYYNLLNENGIRLEEVLEWFFKEYLLNEFGVKNFTINLPSENLTYLEKCKCIIGEIERVLKEFSLYRDYNEIDNEILELITDQIRFEDIKSLLDKKYVYINKENKTINNILFYLFSNQSDLLFIKDKYEDFIQILNNEKINKSMLSQIQLSIVNFLLKENIIQENEKGDLSFDLDLIIILKKLYEQDVLCINYFQKKEKKIEFLKEKKMIYYENTLFSKNEYDYLNYYLNSKFSNGLEFRNKYAHGTHSTDGSQHFNDYFKFLEILVLIIIKINEEFCLYDNLKKKNNL